MKWRCPKCGKPHEKNDPPCDNCGHHKFERAVVPQASADEDREQFVWACSECGRHHQRNNPPCSRCGNATFEKKPLEYEDFEPGSSAGYLELLGKQEVAAIGVIVLFAVVGVLGLLGVITVPGITPQGPPTVENVPGDPDSLGSLDLSDLEDDVVTELNRDRETALRTDSGLDNFATYLNRKQVKATYADGSVDVSRETVDRFDLPCSEPMVGFDTVPPGQEPRPADIASGFTTRDPAATDPGVSTIGIDAHAGPDDRLFVTALWC